MMMMKCDLFTPIHGPNETNVPTTTRSVCWRAEGLVLPPLSGGVPPLPLRAVAGTHLDIIVTFLPPSGSPAANGSTIIGSFADGSAAAGAAAAATGGGAAGGRGSWPHADDALPGAAAGLILKSWRPQGQGAAAVSFCWASRRLEVHFDEVRGRDKFDREV